MAKKKKPHRAADRAYEYLLIRKGQILKYIIVALLTGLFQFLAARLLSMPAIAAFFLRMVLMFALLKIWAYPQSGKEGFTVARQGMIAAMVLLLFTALLNSLILLLANLTAKPMLMAYLGNSLLEILYFILYQFLIFKEND